MLKQVATIASTAEVTVVAVVAQVAVIAQVAVVKIVPAVASYQEETAGTATTDRHHMVDKDPTLVFVNANAHHR